LKKRAKSKNVNTGRKLWQIKKNLQLK
jgi:hypothetical protein